MWIKRKINELNQQLTEWETTEVTFDVMGMPVSMDRATILLGLLIFTFIFVIDYL